MKESMWGYLIITLGLIIIVVIVLIQNITVTQEEDYYLTREVLEASMIDAVDMGSFKSSGEIVMVKEKFVEVFIRRFAESIGKSKDVYRLEFYDINEYPPKASVRILTDSKSRPTGGVEAQETAVKEMAFSVDLNTYLTGILETTDTYLKNQSLVCREALFDDNCEWIKYQYTNQTNSISNFCQSNIREVGFDCCHDKGIPDSKCPARGY